MTSQESGPQSFIRVKKYSVCITTKNDHGTIRASLDHLLSQLRPEESEVIVVDAESTDGSLDILKQYADSGKIKLWVQPCKRGRGREIAFEHSDGAYIISGVDTDDILAPRLQELLSLYHTMYEGRVLHSGLTIAPRAVVEKIGGWRDVFAEDSDFWERARVAGYLSETQFSILPSRQRRERRLLARIVYDVRSFWSCLKTGRKPILSWKTKPLFFAVWFVYRLSHLGRGQQTRP